MTKGRDTGLGSVTIHLGDIDEPFPGPFDHILLHNFNFDGDELKPEHVDFLSDKLIPFLKASSRRVRLEGHASKQGADDYNETLSARRVAAVLSHLRQHGIRENQIAKVDAFGERRSLSESEDDEIDRAVKIHLAPTFLRRPPPPSKKPDPIRIPQPRATPPIFVPPLIPPPIRQETERPVQEIYMKIKWVEGGVTPQPGRIPQGGGQAFPTMLLTERTIMGSALSLATQDIEIKHLFKICNFDFLSLETFTQQRLHVFFRWGEPRIPRCSPSGTRRANDSKEGSRASSTSHRKADRASRSCGTTSWR